MMRIVYAMMIFGGTTFAQTALMREVGPDGQRFFSFQGHCPQTGTYHPIRIAKVETLRNADGSLLKLDFEAPTPSDWDRRGTPMCAYRCAKGLDAIEVDGALMCVGVR